MYRISARQILLIALISGLFASAGVVLFEPDSAGGEGIEVRGGELFAAITAQHVPVQRVQEDDDGVAWHWGGSGVTVHSRESTNFIAIRQPPPRAGVPSDQEVFNAWQDCPPV